MSTELTFNAVVRDEKGTANSRRMRRSGGVPAILYGKKKTPVSLKLDEIEVKKSSRHGLHPNALVKIVIDSKPTTVLIKEIQKSPISNKYIHIDFNEVDLAVKIKAMIPVESIGEAKGVKEQGGVLEHILHELEVECLPTELPEKIEVDVTELLIGDSIHAKDIKVSDKIELLSDPEVTVFAVAAPKVEEEPEPAAEDEESAEPELVDQKGKKDEEGEGEEGASDKKEAKKE